MNRKLPYFLVFFLTSMLLFAYIFETDDTHYKPNIFNHKSNIPNNIYGNNLHQKPIILIHDVSPAYFDELKKIVLIIDKHNYSENTILFVIPDLENPPSSGKWDLRKNREFVNYLHQLENKGYKIELHGYKHTYHEFNCSKSVCLERLRNAEDIMSECGFDNMSLFLPPAWTLSNDSMNVLLEHNYTIILTNELVYPNGTVEKITNKEYTWYISRYKIGYEETMALLDYKTSHAQFYLSLHPKPTCYGGGLVILDHFLNKTR